MYFLITVFTIRPVTRITGTNKGGKMKFEDVYKEFLNGKKVKRSGWINKDYYLGKFKCECMCDNNMDDQDAIANDWEIME